ncbi:hypothetical protein GCM10027430_01290 [Lysobacter tyrosinilyticus]
MQAPQARAALAVAPALGNRSSNSKSTPSQPPPCAARKGEGQKACLPSNSKGEGASNTPPHIAARPFPAQRMPAPACGTPCTPELRLASSERIVPPRGPPCERASPVAASPARDARSPSLRNLHRNRDNNAAQTASGTCVPRNGREDARDAHTAQQ